ncbi:MAG: signal peptide peptidase SppA [Planctomycetota bacterium]|jgi:protease-4
MRHAITTAVLLLGSILGTGCGLRFVIDAVPAEDRLTETPVAGTGTIKVALIDVTGLIADSRRPGLLGGENPLARFTESLHRAEADRKVVAMVVRINSPGGTVTASDVMYRELVAFRQRTRKPVVVLMADVAASGGYYLACGADRIIAHPTTVTGSIGVIMQTFNVADGMRKIGIRADAITSGPNKALGSPFAPMSPEHRALLQGIVDEFYGNFMAVVTESRPAISPADLAEVTDGRVVTGRRAAEVGLVDGTGDLRTAFAAARELAGVETARLVKYHRVLEYVGSAYARAPAAAPEVNLLEVRIAGSPFADVGFYYLWDPTAWE